MKENHKWWYKPHITREDAINLLKSQSPGTFIVRDSNTFPDSFGLALKVSHPAQNSTILKKDISGGNSSTERATAADKWATEFGRAGEKDLLKLNRS